MAGRNLVQRYIIGTAVCMLIITVLYLSLLTNTNGFLRTIETEIKPFKEQGKPQPIPIFFMKTHKTASSAIQNILMRYAVNKNLKVATGQGGDWSRLCYYQLFNRKCVHDVRKLPYDIIAHHLRYNKPEIAASVKPGAKYISVVRDPNDLIHSAFTYFQWNKNLPSKSITDFVEHYNNYKFDKKLGVPYRNLMMYDFGLEIADFDNDESITTKIKEIEESFDLILITEYMFPSLILLKDMLEWDYEDIACLHLNSQSSSKNERLGLDGIRKLRKANKADQLLYDKFLYIFKAKVKEYGEDKMMEEEQKLKQTVERLKNKCLNGTKTSKWSKNVYIKEFKMSDFGKSDPQCQYMVKDELSFTKLFM